MNRKQWLKHIPRPKVKFKDINSGRPPLGLSVNLIPMARAGEIPSPRYIVVEYLKDNMLGLIPTGQLSGYNSDLIKAERTAMAFFKENYAEDSTQIFSQHRVPQRPGQQFIRRDNDHLYTLDKIFLSRGKVNYNLSNAEGETTWSSNGPIRISSVITSLLEQEFTPHLDDAGNHIEASPRARRVNVIEI